MKVQMHIVDEPTNEIPEKTVELPRVPVLGEYVRDPENWYQVKRVVHHTATADDVAAELYVVSIVDPTREPLRLSEWLEPAP